jgi:hypothetical protein
MRYAILMGLYLSFDRGFLDGLATKVLNSNKRLEHFEDITGFLQTRKWKA